MAIVAILGAGMMGSAMCFPLADNGHEVRLAGTPLDSAIIASLRESGVHPTLRRPLPPAVQLFDYTQIDESLRGADLVIGGISSFGVDWLARSLAQSLSLSQTPPVLSVTKGLEDQPDGSLLPLPRALDQKLPSALQGRVRFNAIGGPCIAHELAARRQTSVVFCGDDPPLLAWMRSLLQTSYYHVWTSTDLAGVEICAALKNAYALGVGLAVGQMEQLGPDGLAHNYNPQAALFGQACYEMGCLLRALGAAESSLAWLPGAGDLYVTVFGGRTVALGKLLGKGIPFDEARRIMAGVTLESVEIITRVGRALPRLARRGLLELDDFPLLLHLDGLLNRTEPLALPWDSFFRHAGG